jgi:hypothetical protein
VPIKLNNTNDQSAVSPYIWFASQDGYLTNEIGVINGTNLVTYDVSNSSRIAMGLSDGTTVVLDSSGVQVFLPGCSQQLRGSTSDLSDALSHFTWPLKRRRKRTDRNLSQYESSTHHMFHRRQALQLVPSKNLGITVTVTFKIVDQCNDPYEPELPPQTFIDDRICVSSESSSIPGGGDPVGPDGRTELCTLLPLEKACEDKGNSALSFITKAPSADGQLIKALGLAGIEAAVFCQPCGVALEVAAGTLYLWQNFKPLVQSASPSLIELYCSVFASRETIHVTDSDKDFDNVIAVLDGTSMGPFSGTIQLDNPLTKKVTCGDQICIDTTTNHDNCGTCGNPVSDQIDSVKYLGRF